MTTTVPITMRADPAVKAGFEQICSEIGLSVNAALNIFVKKVVREHRIPFELSADPFYSEANMRHLRASIAEAKAGRVIEHELIED
jgi:DNA-damage-inducible protein J